MLPDDVNTEEKMSRLLEQWESSGDRRSIFLSCYRMMTENMHSAIQTGEFFDPDWVETLLVHFANYYFSAVEYYDLNDEKIPPPWKVAFEAARRADLSVMQHLILGINAHINYDLVFVVVDMLDNEWRSLSAEKREQRHSDHRQVNHIISSTIDAVQDTIVETREPMWDILDKLLGPMDEWLVSRLIADWREDVWERAVLFLDNQDSNARVLLKEKLAKQITERAHLFMI